MPSSPGPFGPWLGRGDAPLGLLAQAEVDAPAASPLQQILQSPFTLMGGLLGLFYFIVIVPEKRRKAAEAARLASVKKNDRIVTIGGIHGVVSAVNENNTLTLRLDENGTHKMKIDRSAVARILTEKGSEE
ncbi:MAG: preprotein translocase subunit YajC [Planctomycetaceae bacterium]|nr:MAG: preprotein translocase subunit YajC [Planctomycetaceae bacterium]